MLDFATALELYNSPDDALPELLAAAHAERLVGTTFPPVVTYSRKVFIPLTTLCRDRCAYCTFVKPPSDSGARTLTPVEVLAIARAGQALGCKEALFSLGERPELVHDLARQHLKQLGYPSMLAYLQAMCQLVLDETGLLPHANPGTLTFDELSELRPVNVSMGMMLENISLRLHQKGGAHFGCPDKLPAVRLETLRAAGELSIPFTTGILIGIGETRVERLEALFAIRDLHRQYGHIQEVIIQNFRAKVGTRMAGCSEPDLSEMLRTLAVARLVFGDAMNIQAPPNLMPNQYRRYLDAGLNDWGGISPVTPDHINPEAAWPQVEILRSVCSSSGFVLRERTALYNAYTHNLSKWVDSRLHAKLGALLDSDGLVRADLTY